MTSPAVREAREHELDDIAELMFRAYVEYAPPRSDPDIEVWDHYFEDIKDVRSRLADSSLLVLEDEGHLIGAVTYYPPGASVEMPAASTREEWPPGWAAFRLLAVDPDVRGKGYGRVLTEACLDRARTAGAPVLALHTTQLMDVARAMYERMGFQRVPEHDFEPMPGFVVMAYKLDLT